ncbi:High-affinity nickel-transporter [Actinomadura sp. DC4]|uniref:HoxN/HupN/NixA family nickel/cobalt transporter n=1 Tax=Actinomadura sp. DC4 TaxID=3055069 RepID=UPI0025B129B7|nr:High-affinity nickel-transporter [Actinomadura sp. DC4]MDN3358523.1 High-affinity nickel-transporter [Actinomadura sp. DC4]
MRRLIAVVLLVAGVLSVTTGASAVTTTGAMPAHPLGNFTVNHYDGLTLFPDHIADTAVVDAAEIPTLQDKSAVDTGHDGSVDAAEMTTFARGQCAGLARATRTTLAGRPLGWSVTSTSYAYVPGAAGLRTSRLTCQLTARADLVRPSEVGFANGFRADRIGWHEITATGRGVRLVHSPVPRSSVSDELRRYPGDLLTSPLNVRSATLRTAPGEGSSVRNLPGVPSAGIISRGLNRLTAYFDSLVGARHLTVPVGLLALLLAVALGASHAAMPGHGKTVMAAYIAGRSGRIRDAVTVGMTVTVTHTGGVLLLGFLLSVSTSLAGESLLSWLGVISGLLVMAIGLGLLRSAWRARRVPTPFGGHTTDPGRVEHMVAVGHLPAPSGAPQPHAHDQEHGHSRGPGHGHRHGHGHGHAVSRSERGRLIGLGVSGGLVPSPSALVVLLGAIALGRTIFGVALIIGYGIGMAATLTAAGLLLLRLRGLLDRLPAGHRASRLTRYTPMFTAVLVTVVGAGLALRAITGSV